MPYVEGDAVEMALRMSAGIDYANSIKSDDVREHYIWLNEQLAMRIGLEDLSVNELVSLATVLIPAHSRVIAGGRRPAEPPTGAASILRMVRDDAV